MTQPINIISLMLLLVIGAFFSILAFSPDALDSIARKMRARARGLRAAKKYYEAAWDESMAEDSAREQERNSMALLVDAELRERAR